MKASVVAFLCLGASVIIACGNAPSSEETENGQSELSSKNIVRREVNGPSCMGWACGRMPTNPTDLDVFNVLSKYEPAVGVPATTRAASIECGTISGGCQPATCNIRTMCGGGGVVYNEEDNRILEDFIRSRNVPTESVGWASRQTILSVVCQMSGTSGSTSGGTDPHHPVPPPSGTSTSEGTGTGGSTTPPSVPTSAPGGGTSPSPGGGGTSPGLPRVACTFFTNPSSGSSSGWPSPEPVPGGSSGGTGGSTPPSSGTR
jgi:hypothetical protein